MMLIFKISLWLLSRCFLFGWFSRPFFSLQFYSFLCFIFFSPGGFCDGTINGFPESARTLQCPSLRCHLSWWHRSEHIDWMGTKWTSCWKFALRTTHHIICLSNRNRGRKRWGGGRWSWGWSLLLQITSPQPSSRMDLCRFAANWPSSNETRRTQFSLKHHNIHEFKKEKKTKYFISFSILWINKNWSNRMKRVKQMNILFFLSISQIINNKWTNLISRHPKHYKLNFREMVVVGGGFYL